MRRRRGQPRIKGAGFTLIEVMIALVIATIGLLGTLAVQVTVMNATLTSNDAAIATQLATQGLEELSARTITAGPPIVDQLSGLVTDSWATPVFISAQGQQSATQTADARFKRESKVVNLGFANPYNVSVRVTYFTDNGTARTVRLDQERRKTW